MTTETAAADRVELPGGEMLAWSDERQGRSAGGAPLAALAARLVPAGARVLLAGRHDPALADRLVALGADLTCLVRGYPDGAALAERLPGVRVVVAGPDGVPTTEPFDVVIAGAGLGAVESVEGPPVPWHTVLERLAGVLRPGGVLLLAHPNPLGLHRMVAAEPWYASRDDADWTVCGVLTAEQPANLADLRARLAVVGLTPTASFAAYPDPVAATVLLATEDLDGAPTAGLFDAVLHEACTQGFAGEAVLRDPARLAVDALHAGLATALAPGWLLVAVKGGGTDATELPVALLQAGSPPCAVEVVRDVDGWSWRVPERPAEPDPAPFATRPVAYREPGALAGPVAPGRVLRTVLLDACTRRDLTMLRRLLRGYADWLAGQADDGGRLHGAYGMATPDNVVVDGDACAVLDPSWRSTAPLALDVVLSRGLWRVAAELVTGGYAHPWASTLDAAGLTVVLGGLAGRDLDRPAVTLAVEIEAEINAGLRGLDPAGRVELAGELHALESTAPPVGLKSYQQVREAWLRQRDEITRLRALVSWTEQLLTSRERALKRAELTISLLSGSISYRVGRLVITPARLAKRSARKARTRVGKVARRLGRKGSR